MNNSKAKTKKESKPITSQQYRKLFLFLSFFIPLEMMLMVFARSIVYPFGDECFLNSDLYHQYYPFFVEFVRKVRAGEGFFYSWNMGMGVNFYIVYAYYLASPLNWLAFLVPEKYLLEFVSYLVVFKVGLAGLTSYLYLINRKSEDKSTRAGFFALFFSYCYAMSGYVAGYNINIMWMDCIVLAPLILMGLERLVKEGKNGLYIITLALCIISNFYLSILICFFLVLYFVLLLFTENKRKGTICKFAVSSLIAGGIAAVIVVPVAVYTINSNVEQARFPSSIEFYFSIFEEFARHCMMIKPTSDHGTLPNIYCGTWVFLFVPLYIMNKGVPLKKKIGYSLLAFFMLLSFMVNYLSYIWHGMNYPAGFPARQAFLYIVLLLAMGYDCFMQLEGLATKNVLIAYAIAAPFLILTKLFFESEGFHEWDWLITLVFVTMYCVCACSYYRLKKTKRLEKIAIVFYVIVLVECTYNMSETSVITTTRERTYEFQEDYKVLINRRENQENGFQRYESLSMTGENDPSLYGYASASVFSSIMNTDISDFYSKMGLRHEKAFIESDGATPFCLALLNDAYLFSRNASQENELYQLVDEENGLYLFQSKNILPFGYVAPFGFDVTEEGDAIFRQNDLAAQLGIRDLFKSELNSNKENPRQFKASNDGFYYAVIHNTYIPNLSIEYKDGSRDHFERVRKNYVLELGYLQKGCAFEFITDDMDEGWDEPLVSLYRIDLRLLKEAVDLLGKNHMSHTEINGTSVSGKLELEEQGRLIVSIPCDKGWTIFINGEKREPSRFGEALIAFDLGPGSYKIEMHYYPAGLKLGIGISLFSLLIFALLIFCGKRKAIVHFS